MAALQRWCRVTVTDGESRTLTGRVLEGRGDPDLGAVDAIARLALLAGRLGGHIVIDQVSPAMGELLELAGLPVEMKGQPELGEER
jgi:hypothetical protein